MRLSRFLLALAMSVAGTLPARAYDMTYQNMLIATMKLDPNFDYDNIVDSYMQDFRPTVWQRSHDDEFQRRGKEAETLDMMKKAAASFDLSEPIVIHTSIQFGEYDFKVHQFALDPFSASSFFPVNHCCNSLPGQIKLYFSNPTLIDGLPMGEAAAQAFVDQHKQYGNVNRTLEAEISVRLKSVKASDEVIGEITKVILRDPMNKNAVLKVLAPQGSI